MVKKINVLGIDDHAVVLEGYHSIFRSLDGFDEVRFTKAHDCRSGSEVIYTHKDDPFDVAVLDYSMPPFPEKHLYSGEDMAMLLRQAMPSCKIIMMTMHNNISVLSSILEKVRPEGFINKSDCSCTELMEAFKAVLQGATYFSETVAAFMARQESGMLLEELDIKIILLLANGIKTCNLNKYIPLSESSIEKRKYRIKRLLNISGGDEELIRRARALGYI
ncbi:response regulator transcription factor [Flavobacterium sp. MFBS3-15]|uniref:response regulator n=1 Tax=Flavobacterium sp. MFBS3-15 TaxID=2989816 RepID=UPI002235588D|nr:response regulator transcription factor [Flavobacterium sp. MFBS3-15]MCW4469262.1 response regulator transcription factor [Flavobacterium sp. MFBS3-15]